MRIAVLLALCAGCFNPRYGSQTFYCHAEDNPACPDGQYCVDGRCQSTPGGGTVILDGGMPRNQDFGGLQPMDLSMGNPFPQFDLSMPPQNQLNGCHNLIHCLVACTNTTCENNCYAAATANAKTLEQTAVGCGQGYCVNTSFECMDDGTGHLVDAFGAPTGACNACLNNALAALTGTSCSPGNSPDCNPAQCTSQTNACVSDLP